MRRFESVFWAVQEKSVLEKKLKALGFSFSPSRQESESTSEIFFGPDRITLVSQAQDTQTFKPGNDFLEYLKVGGGIYGLGIETDQIAHDYGHLKVISPDLEKPHKSGRSKENVPNWFSFSVPQELTPKLRTSILMNSNVVLNELTKETLPLTHENTCFGIEGVHVLSESPEEHAKKWALIFDQPISQLQWNEGKKAEGWRLQIGGKSIDFIKTEDLAHAGPFMLTLNVTDIERAKAICEKAGARLLKCQTRDGFIVPSDFTSGPALRFTRSFWKRYLPEVSKNFPEGRRTDQFRPLGGTNTTTLEAGFQDDWSY